MLPPPCSPSQPARSSSYPAQSSSTCAPEAFRRPSRWIRIRSVTRERKAERGARDTERGVKQHHCCGISSPFAVIGITRNIPASIVYFLGIVSDFTCHLLSSCASGDPHNLDNTMRNNTNWRRSSGSASIMMVTLASTCLPRMHVCSGTRYHQTLESRPKVVHTKPASRHPRRKPKP